eukprot:752657-Hanusia_phi.AAC.3
MISTCDHKKSHDRVRYRTVSRLMVARAFLYSIAVGFGIMSAYQLWNHHTAGALKMNRHRSALGKWSRIPGSGDMSNKTKKGRRRHTEEYMAVCDVQRPEQWVVDMKYETWSDKSASSKKKHFFVSVHDPSIDTVISKGILDGLWGPKNKYPSVTEMYSICKFAGSKETRRPYDLDCGNGKVFIEGGAAIGMVARIFFVVALVDSDGTAGQLVHGRARNETGGQGQCGTHQGKRMPEWCSSLRARERRIKREKLNLKGKTGRESKASSCVFLISDDSTTKNERKSHSNVETRAVGVPSLQSD